MVQVTFKNGPVTLIGNEVKVGELHQILQC